jgi:hypothetical protein
MYSLHVPFHVLISCAPDLVYGRPTVALWKYYCSFYSTVLHEYIPLNISNAKDAGALLKVTVSKDIGRHITLYTIESVLYL